MFALTTLSLSLPREGLRCLFDRTLESYNHTSTSVTLNGRCWGWMSVFPGDACQPQPSRRRCHQVGPLGGEQDVRVEPPLG